MKKQNAYTIHDDIFLDALELINDHFQSIHYAIVGGGAVQVYVSAVAVKKYGLNSVKALNGMSLALRRTGDIDLSFNLDDSQLIQTFNFILQNPSGPYSFHNFAKRFILQDGPRRFNLNYQTRPEDLKGIPAYYQDIIDTALTVEIPHKQRLLRIKTAKPEYLITSKLTRIKPKDQVDIMLLLNAMEWDQYPFDAEEVRSVLKSVNKGDHYDILVELMDAV